jgi:hypothetical protein
MTADGRPGRLWDPRRIDIRFIGQQHKNPPAATARAPADTPRGRTTRTPLLTVAESDIVAGHEFHNPREKPQSEIGPPAVRDSSVGEARTGDNLSARAGCGEGTIRGSSANTATRPRDCRNHMARHASAWPVTDECSSLEAHVSARVSWR